MSENEEIAAELKKYDMEWIKGTFNLYPVLEPGDVTVKRVTELMGFHAISSGATWLKKNGYKFDHLARDPENNKLIKVWVKRG